MSTQLSAQMALDVESSFRPSLKVMSSPECWFLFPVTDRDKTGDSCVSPTVLFFFFLFFFLVFGFGFSTQGFSV